jgi:hypothetical protein
MDLPSVQSIASPLSDTPKITSKDLRKRAALFWPAELTKREATNSILPLLLKSQDKFISLLTVADASPTAWKEVLRATADFPSNLFLKHLMILADVGGEPLKRIRPELARLFPKRKMHYRWRDADFEYTFQTNWQKTNISNDALKIDGKSLSKGSMLDAKTEDIIMLLLYGGSSLQPTLPELLTEKCVIGSLIGQKDELQRFIQERYILVSRITGGATSNTLGQLVQDYVRDTLKERLPNTWEIRRNAKIPGISQNDGRTDMNFDVLAASPQGKYVAIEISFQVTTNSTIERKAGQAQSRASLLHQMGHYITYVLDGAGNFERASAIETICDYSDCTVTLTLSELERLTEFLKSVG